MPSCLITWRSISATVTFSMTWSRPRTTIKLTTLLELTPFSAAFAPPPDAEDPDPDASHPLLMLMPLLLPLLPLLPLLLLPLLPPLLLLPLLPLLPLPLLPLLPLPLLPLLPLREMRGSLLATQALPFHDHQPPAKFS